MFSNIEINIQIPYNYNDSSFCWYTS